MKKLFLLLALGTTISAANAQTVVSNPAGTMRMPALRPAEKQHPARLAASRHSEHRTTSGTTYNYDWFDYWNQNAQAGTEKAYYFPIYPDSNLFDASQVSATNSGYGFWHGLGMSFDPTDNNYYDAGFNYQITDTPRIIQTTAFSTPYTVDSFNVLFNYIRNNPSAAVTDSLIIDLIATTVGVDSGTYMLSYAASAANGFITPDSTPREALADYMPSTFPTFPNECWDSITAPHKQRFAFPLTAASVNDTDVNGFNILTGPNTEFATNLSVPGGMKVVAYVTFKSGVAYPLGTPIGSANYIKLFAGDPAGAGTWPQQTPHDATTGYKGSYQTGLASQNQTAYGFPDFNGHNLLFAPFAFVNPATTTQQGPFGIEVPFMAFHLGWIMQGPLGVGTEKNITSVNVAPNPANDAAVITFHLATPSSVSISLTDMVGSLVSAQSMENSVGGTTTINTSKLAAGVYFYTINANGERTTGRIVVAH